jgi:hypothetical protein
MHVRHLTPRQRHLGLHPGGPRCPSFEGSRLWTPEGIRPQYLLWRGLRRMRHSPLVRGPLPTPRHGKRRLRHSADPRRGAMRRQRA